jgi:flagellar biosynthesis protein FliQ
MLGAGVARSLSAALPVAVAPMLAAVGALGVVVALAMAATQAGRRGTG